MVLLLLGTGQCRAELRHFWIAEDAAGKWYPRWCDGVQGPHSLDRTLSGDGGQVSV